MSIIRVSFTKGNDENKQTNKFLSYVIDLIVLNGRSILNALNALKLREL